MAQQRAAVLRNPVPMAGLGSPSSSPIARLWRDREAIQFQRRQVDFGAAVDRWLLEAVDQHLVTDPAQALLAQCRSGAVPHQPLHPVPVPGRDHHRCVDQCVTQWAVNWEKKGWRKPGGEIKNLDLIQPMFALYTKLRRSIQVLRVNGHIGVEGNELADRMSIHGIENKEQGFVHMSCRPTWLWCWR